MTLYTLVGLSAGLFFLSFAHEETAIIAGGYLITGHQMHWGLVLVALTAGIVAGDWAIYWLGAASRHVGFFRRFVKSEKVIRPREWLDRRLLLVIVVARLCPGPGVLFPVFSSIGLFGVSFARFALLSAVVAGFYTPMMLYLTTMYGNAFVPWAGWWAWLALFLVPLLAVVGPWGRGLRQRAGEWAGIRLQERNAPEEGGNIGQPLVSEHGSRSERLQK